MKIDETDNKIGMKMKNVLYRTIVIVLLLLFTSNFYAQNRHEKTAEIIRKLNLIEAQTLTYQYQLDPLKQHVSGKDSVRLVELEKQLAVENVLKVINKVFDKHLSDNEIDNIYAFLQSSAYKKLFNPAVIFQDINRHFSYIDEEIAQITNNIDASKNESTSIFVPIPIDREDGFYTTIGYRDDTDIENVQLEQKPSITFGDILQVSKHSVEDLNSEIYIQLTKLGARKLYTLTKDNIGKPLAIVVNGKIVTMPIINDSIIGGRVAITGNFTDNEIDEMIFHIKEN